MGISLTVVLVDNPTSPQEKSYTLQVPSDTNRGVKNKATEVKNQLFAQRATTSSPFTIILHHIFAGKITEKDIITYCRFAALLGETFETPAYVLAEISSADKPDFPPSLLGNAFFNEHIKEMTGGDHIAQVCYSGNHHLLRTIITMYSRVTGKKIVAYKSNQEAYLAFITHWIKNKPK